MNQMTCDMILLCPIPYIYVTQLYICFPRYPPKLYIYSTILIFHTFSSANITLWIDCLSDGLLYHMLNMLYSTTTHINAGDANKYYLPSSQSGGELPGNQIGLSGGSGLQMLDGPFVAFKPPPFRLPNHVGNFSEKVSLQIIKLCHINNWADNVVTFN